MVSSIQTWFNLIKAFFPLVINMHEALYDIAIIALVYPLLQLDLQQSKKPLQNSETAWMTSIRDILQAAYHKSGVDDTEECN